MAPVLTSVLNITGTQGKEDCQPNHIILTHMASQFQDNMGKTILKRWKHTWQTQKAPSTSGTCF